MTDKNENKLLGLYKKVYSSSFLVLSFRILGYASVLYEVSLFAWCLYVRTAVGITEGVRFAIAAAIPFLAVSVLRHVIDTERPYQAFDFSEFTDLPPKSKLGKSFPSRHVFSAFLIGTLALEYSLVLGISAIILGILLALVRVTLGIHFPKDVISGAIIGVVSGVVGILFL